MFGLETDRLIIRPWHAEDRPAFTTLMSDPAVMQHVHGSLPFTETEVDDWLGRQSRQLAQHDVCMGAVIEKATGRLIGLSGTQPLGTTGDLEIGWIFTVFASRASLFDADTLPVRPLALCFTGTKRT